ncbi:hypothetical protein BDR22DRAFT_283171 [Usnea florida]
MHDQQNEKDRSKDSGPSQMVNGRWESSPTAGKEADGQDLASTNYSAAINRWVQEPSGDAPWNAIDRFQKAPLAKKQVTSGGPASTNGATAGSEASISNK